MVLDPLSLALAGAGSAVCVWFSRLRRCCASNQELLQELERRGFDVEHYAMDIALKKNYVMGKSLGKGASGEVWKVEHKASGMFYAMKMIVKEKRKSAMNARENLEREISCLRQLRHRHIVNLVDVLETDKTMAIIMELVEGGELYDFIVRATHFSEQIASQVVKQTLQAVHYMHSMGYVHRDLKSENILLDINPDDTFVVKVADLGLCVKLELQGFHPEESQMHKSRQDIEGGFVGSPVCMAPEVAEDEARYGPQCDIWSTGCIAHELVIGRPPFVAANKEALFVLVKQSKGLDLSGEEYNNVSGPAKDLLSSMLQVDPAKRPSAKEALDHPWFREAPDHHNEQAHGELSKVPRLKCGTRFQHRAKGQLHRCDTDYMG